MVRIGILIVVLLAAAITWGYLQPETEQAMNETDARGADYWIEDIEVTVFDIQGSENYTLAARRLSHQKEGGNHLIDGPHMNLIHEQGTHWQVTAATGEVNADGSRIDFDGNVRMTRSGHTDESDPATSRLTVFSDDMRVLPEQNRLETDGPVEILTPTSETHAVGMRAFTETERLQLLSNVRSKQLPRPE